MGIDGRPRALARREAFRARGRRPRARIGAKGGGRVRVCLDDAGSELSGARAGCHAGTGDVGDTVARYFDMARAVSRRLAWIFSTRNASASRPTEPAKKPGTPGSFFASITMDPRTSSSVFPEPSS